MAANKPNRLWAAVVFFLIVIIVIGGIVVWSRIKPEQPLEISISQPQEQNGEIYIGGAVSNPGLYSLRQGDSIDALIRAAGGAGSSANLSGLELFVPGAGAEQGEQIININRAEVWLLEALPGIGETLAQRIVDYRQKNGLFRNVDELLKVPGIGTTTYERIKGLITVADR